MSKEKQIAEIVTDISEVQNGGWKFVGDSEYTTDVSNEELAEHLYEQGYRKQSEGEWIDSLKGYCQCSNCRTSFETLPTTFLFKLNNKFCRNCGAKMKGGAE